MKTLNIVNGDTSIDIMKKAGIKGDFLPWLDFLHEGPVPKGLSSNELAHIRTDFIAKHIQGDSREISNEFKKRNKVLENYKQYDHIILWFEHDLYDQLQLLEALSWFSSESFKSLELSMITTDTYINQLELQKVNKIYNNRVHIIEKHLTLAHQAWQAFREPTPLKWSELLNEPTESILPFLKTTIVRSLEEFPHKDSGLSRTQKQILIVLSQGIHEAGEIFQKSQELEERPFMGEVVFWKLLHDFEVTNVIKRENKKLLLSTLGEELLEGQKNWLAIETIDRYIGGTHLHPDNLWCWDKDRKKIQKYYYSKVLNLPLPIK